MSLSEARFPLCGVGINKTQKPTKLPDENTTIST